MEPRSTVLRKWRIDTMVRLASGVLFSILPYSVAYGDANPINLEWRPDAQTVRAGATVDVGLYAVYDDVGGTTDGSISAVDVILSWNPTVLELTGASDNSPYEWLFSGFPDDAGFDGLNDTWLDGNALYNAMSQFAPSPPALATTDGLLLTTVQFEALAETPETVLTIPVDYGLFTRSRVFDGEIPGFEVQGTLGSATVRIIESCSPSVGDVNGDEVINMTDVEAAIAVLLAPYDATPEQRTAADANCDGDVDGRDIQPLIDLWLLLL